MGVEKGQEVNGGNDRHMGVKGGLGRSRGTK